MFTKKQKKSSRKRMANRKSGAHLSYLMASKSMQKQSKAASKSTTKRSAGRGE